MAQFGNNGHYLEQNMIFGTLLKSTMLNFLEHNNLLPICMHMHDVVLQLCLIYATSELASNMSNTLVHIL